MRRLASLAVVPAYLLLTLIFTWPLARDFATAVPQVDRQFIDPLLQAYLIAWDWKALEHGPHAVFDAPNFHPEPRTLTYMDDLLGQAALGFPVWSASGSVAAGYNAVLVLAWVGTAWATYRLLRALGVSRGGSFLGGFLFTFGSYRFVNLVNLNQSCTQWVPAALFFVVRFVQKGRARDGALALLGAAVQTWFGWYYAYHLVVALAIGFAFAWRQRRRESRRFPWLPLALAAIAAAAVVLPGAWPYVEQRRAMGGFGRSLGATALYSADVLDWFRPHNESKLFAWLPGRGLVQAFWPGLVAVVLGILGGRALRGARPRPAAWVAMAWIGVAAFVLSFGPLLHVAGRRLPIPLPYALVYFLVPGFSSMRAPSRFAELALLALAAFAGLGFDAARRRWRAVNRRGWPALVAGLAVIAAVESWSAPLLMIALPDAARMPPAYRWLAAQADRAPVLEWPLPASEAEEAARDAIRQYWGLFHGHPRLDGVSGFSPPDHERFRAAMQAFPADSALAAARARGAELFVVRLGEVAAPRRTAVAAAIARARALRLVARFGDDWVLGWRSTERR